jgi:hypothetical protein
MLPVFAAVRLQVVGWHWMMDVRTSLRFVQWWNLAQQDLLYVANLFASTVVRFACTRSLKGEVWRRMYVFDLRSSETDFVRRLWLLLPASMGVASLRKIIPMLFIFILKGASCCV